MIGGNVTKQISKSENVSYIVKRHPIGLVPIYLFVLVGTLVVLIVFGGLINSREDNLINLPDGILGLLMIFLILFIFVAGLIGRSVYWANALMITDENIIQVLRPTLLNQEVAQLNLAKIQDVSVYQKGAFQMAFKYGTVVIETAGEISSYHFAYAPRPNDLAAKIILAHDEYIAKHGISKEALGTP